MHVKHCILAREAVAAQFGDDVVRDDEFAIQTFEYEGAPDQVSIEFLTFTDLGGGRTRLTGKSVYPSVETRDAMVDNGMERGVSEGYERLDSLLSSVPAS